MKHLGLLKFEDLYQLHCSILIHDCIYKVAPQAIQSGINRTVKNSHNLCNQKERHLNLDIPTFKTKARNNSFFCKGPQIWNALADDLRTLNKKDRFKRAYKIILLESYEKKLICTIPNCRDKQNHKCTK